MVLKRRLSAVWAPLAQRRRRRLDARHIGGIAILAARMPQLPFRVYSGTPDLFTIATWQNSRWVPIGGVGGGWVGAEAPW